ncbi:protein of unknown function [Candidatus Promineifilum breve]|uniref:Uncharacterized protein n=1 Tax=Candidatus Promineifilum breve TaxID=1806508 RepID=A0A160TB51_9CHLR|nr:hypothetical protein [Candidatus Promineifilum breve]CUS06370.1 protein of unknown function [Candidatus Promineifilum breve]
MEAAAVPAGEGLNPINVTFAVIAAVFWQLGMFVLYFTDWLEFADYTLPVCSPRSPRHLTLEIHSQIMINVTPNL